MEENKKAPKRKSSLTEAENVERTVKIEKRLQGRQFV